MSGLRAVAGDKGREMFLTLAAEPSQAAERQARQMYATVAGHLEESGARIFCERIFGTAAGIEAAMRVRRQALGRLDDGVGPTRIVCAVGRGGSLAGIQVHAVVAESNPEAVGAAAGNGGKCGRRLTVGGRRWLMLNEIASVAAHERRGDEAASMFDQAGKMLAGCGADMRCVARTWLWLDDICGWYGDFNASRTAFFRAQGLIAADGRGVRLPASTGIGLGNMMGRSCVMDLLALPGGADEIELLEAGGAQNSAFSYGSAFSRAAIVPMPAGRMLLVSGTAAIDAGGRTEHVGQVERQIEATIGHVRSLLSQQGCGDEQILSALVYCRTAEVERAFHDGRRGLGWPALSMVAEVCRRDMEFEIELVAGPLPAGGNKGGRR
jgi:enamine deaminase RidA (YjgF/YER057c/UK114 family)